MYDVDQTVPMIVVYVECMADFLKNGEKEELNSLVRVLKEAIKKEEEAGLHNEKNPLDKIFSPLGPEAEAAYQKLENFVNKTMPCSYH